MLPVLPASLVGSYAPPDWLIDLPREAAEGKMPAMAGAAALLRAEQSSLTRVL